MTRNTQEYTNQVLDILTRLPHDDIDKAIEVLQKARSDDRRIFIMGNGGSGSTASHITGDLMKGCDMGGSLVMCLNDNMATFSAWANDDCYGMVFAEQIDKLVRIGDVVLAISGSGNSGNIVAGIAGAASLGAATIALTGFDGGGARQHADISIIVPSDNMQQIEDVHLMIGHMIALAMR